MIRFIIVITFLFLFLVVSLVIQPIMLLIGLFSKKARSKVSLAIVNWAFGVVRVFAGAKVTYINHENVPKDEAVLYILNHRSYFDIILTYVKVPGPTGYVAKKEMSKTLTLAWWMRLLHCTFMDRKDLKKGMQTIKDNIALIENGISVAIFPEGTRNKTDEKMLEFHKGSFKIAEKTGCKIVPVVIHNTADVFENQFPKMRKANVTIEYLEPIDVSKLDKDQKKTLADDVRNIMMEKY